MYRRSTNNPWVPPGGLNAGSFAQIGGEDTAPVLALASGARFGGLLGATVVHDNASALKASKTTVGTLFMGVYQLVKFTSAITRGHILVWDTLANNGLADYEVTATSTAVGNFRAGVALFTDAQATGKFGYIQVAGLASMLYGAAPVATLGTMVFQGASAAVDLTVNTVTTIADATAASTDTTAELKGLLGIAYETPAAATVLRVLLNPFGWYANIGRG